MPSDPQSPAANFAVLSLHIAGAALLTFDRLFLLGRFARHAAPSKVARSSVSYSVLDAHTPTNLTPLAPLSLTTALAVALLTFNPMTQSVGR